MPVAAYVGELDGPAPGASAVLAFGPPRTVLVVDDDDAVRESLAEVMASAGHAVLSAGDGEEALEILGLHRVHVVVLDVVMPGLDGLSLLAGLDCPPPAVILHSAVDDAAWNRARASVAGKTFLSIGKPAPPALLLAAVAEAADRNPLPTD